MRPSSVLLLVHLCGIGNAITWHVPPDIKDGYYSITLDEANSQVPTLEAIRATELEVLTEFNSSLELSPNHTLSRRDFSIPVHKKGCMNNPRKLDPVDHYDTKRAMYNWCDRGWKIERRTLMVGVRNDTLYWVCNHKKGRELNECSSKELVAAEKIFNETCGEDKGAWVELKKWKKSYGRMNKGTTKENSSIKCRQY